MDFAVQFWAQTRVFLKNLLQVAQTYALSMCDLGDVFNKIIPLKLPHDIVDQQKFIPVFSPSGQLSK